jgi:hypothetical protein
MRCTQTCSFSFTISWYSGEASREDSGGILEKHREKTAEVKVKEMMLNVQGNESFVIHGRSSLWARKYGTQAVPAHNWVKSESGPALH